MSSECSIVLVLCVFFQVDSSSDDSDSDEDDTAALMAELERIKKERAEEFATRLKEVMEGVYTISVPLTVDVSTGNNWGEI